MNTSQKGFANIVLIIVIVILVGVVGYFAFVKKSEPIAQQPTPTPTQTTTTTNTPVPTTPTPVKTITPTPVSAKVSSVLPSGSMFTQGEGAMIPLSWSVVNPPAGATIYLDLLSSDGSESLGRITNNPDCSKGGDTVALAISVKMYKWDGLYVCSNWQAHSVNPGNYRIGVSLYSADGTSVVATAQSDKTFNLKK